MAKRQTSWWAAILLGATMASAGSSLTEVMGVPWLGGTDAFLKVFPNAVRAERMELVNGTVFEDYRVDSDFHGIPVEAAFLFYKGRLFRVVMRFKNFRENQVIDLLNRLFGQPDGNRWTMIYSAGPDTLVVLDGIDDTVTISDKALGEQWEVQHQRTLQERGYQGRYGGG